MEQRRPATTGEALDVGPEEVSRFGRGGDALGRLPARKPTKPFRPPFAIQDVLRPKFAIAASTRFSAIGRAFAHAH